MLGEFCAERTPTFFPLCLCRRPCSRLRATLFLSAYGVVTVLYLAGLSRAHTRLGGRCALFLSTPTYPPDLDHDDATGAHPAASHHEKFLTNQIPQPMPVRTRSNDERSRMSAGTLHTKFFVTFCLRRLCRLRCALLSRICRHITESGVQGSIRAQLESQ